LLTRHRPPTPALGAGSVIAVSHDRYFLRRIATRIVTVDSGKLVDYQGDYELFLEQNEEEAEKMEAKEEKQREIEKSQIKAKSKMSKAEKAKAKKDKAKAFNQGPSAAGKAPKNAKRWN
jgi:ATPase subunit of ABC transporter with duplicated ATPase domains